MSVIFRVNKLNATAPPDVLNPKEIQIANNNLTYTTSSINFVVGDNTLEVFVNGVLCYLGIDYQETANNQVTFSEGRIKPEDKILFKKL